jgi:hypothetical protein
MDQNFQTSFIPKKPIVEERVVSTRPINIFSVVGVLLLFAMIVSTGALYFYKLSLIKNISQMASDLELAKNRFEPARITQLNVLDKKLRASNQILSKHIAVSPIFEALEAVTLPTVRYTKFSYALAVPPETAVNIKMTGVAVGYKSIALQSDIFTKNKSIIDPVFSNLVLDNHGNVVFDLNFSIDPNMVNYKQVLKANTPVEAPVEAPTN